LRDSIKPMGVADYKLSAALPAPLQAALPTAEDLAREFPMMTLVKLRIDIERELRALIEGDGVESDRPLVLSEMVRLNEGVRDLPPRRFHRHRQQSQQGRARDRHPGRRGRTSLSDCQSLPV